MAPFRSLGIAIVTLTSKVNKVVLSHRLKSVQYARLGKRNPMIDRIGNVLYWLACSVAGLTVIAGIAIYASEGRTRSDGLGVLAGFCVAAFLLWLVGRACRYILSGR